MVLYDFESRKLVLIIYNYKAKAIVCFLSLLSELMVEIRNFLFYSNSYFRLFINFLLPLDGVELNMNFFIKKPIFVKLGIQIFSI